MKYYEVTSVDTGNTKVMSESECRKTFGKDEWVEVREGYLPNIIVVEVEKPE